MNRPIFNLVAGFALFCAAYVLMNQHLLVQTILYRLAAYDYETPVIAFSAFALQAVVLFYAVIVLPRRWFIALMALVTVAAAVNIVYGAILDDRVDLAKTGWLISEARQAGNAAGEFLLPMLAGIAKTAIAVLCLVGARKFTRAWLDLDSFGIAGRPRGRRAAWIAMTLFFLPSLVLQPLQMFPLAAERNVFSYAVTILTEDIPPREQVAIKLRQHSGIEKIVWLVDESVSHDIYTRILRDEVQRFGGLDFGEAWSMGHCSGPANFTLRSGVDVRNVDARSDLRTAPSIWAYAKRAGYRTMLVDGQVQGAPQNMLFETERELIDEYVSAAAGLKTDLSIAKWLNETLKSDDRLFAKIVLRGVHFQYRDHYPSGMIPAESPVEKHYETAVRYSKDGFFETLFDGVERENIAIIYTSDHGQNVGDGVLPHCSRDAAQAEFSVPLAAFLPERIAAPYALAQRADRSHSQIFPATLIWMGFDRQSVVRNYDNDLTELPSAYLRFGRNVVPVGDDGTIEVSRSNTP